MCEGEFLFAYLHDIYIVTRRERVGVRIHGGKTQGWGETTSL